MHHRIPGGRFRRRLTIAFVAIAAVASGTIGLGAYLLVRNVRTDDFVERSIRDAHGNYLALQQVSEPLDEDQLVGLVRRIERRAADATVIFGGGREYASRPRISIEDVPSELLSSDANGDAGPFLNKQVRRSGEPFLIVATPPDEVGTRMVFFYSKASLERSLWDLAGILWRLWLVVIVGAALVGNTLARRTLRPVSRASEAARSLAEGLLETRLPVEREDEFGAWAVSFNEMADALETKISQLIEAHDRERRFTSDVSHELRTPLTALVGSTSMLEERLDLMDADTRWIAEQMIRETRRVRSLVDELLEISRLHSGRETVRKSDVDLGLLVENVIRSQGWADVVSFKPSNLRAWTDKARAERIVVNLIGNAVQHGKENPRVRLGENDGYSFVEVRDDGPGISDDDLPHIFERFYKADPSRAGGTGLGLPIAAENALLLGGDIYVSTNRGRGATFTLRLPRSGSSPSASARDLADTESLQL